MVLGIGLWWQPFSPSVPIGQEFEPGGIAAADLPDRPPVGQDDQMIENFRELVRRRLGDLAVAVFDLRMDGGETKSLVGSATLGSPSKWAIKKVVQEIKTLGRQFAASLGDFGLLRRIERAMEEESQTVARRRATTLQKVGA